MSFLTSIPRDAEYARATVYFFFCSEDVVPLPKDGTKHLFVSVTSFLEGTLGVFFIFKAQLVL